MYFYCCLASGSPTKENDKTHPATLPNDLHNSPGANLAYFQVITVFFVLKKPQTIHCYLNRKFVNISRFPLSLFHKLV